MRADCLFPHVLLQSSYNPLQLHRILNFTVVLSRNVYGYCTVYNDVAVIVHICFGLVLDLSHWKRESELSSVWWLLQKLTHPFTTAG